MKVVFKVKKEKSRILSNVHVFAFTVEMTSRSAVRDKCHQLAHFAVVRKLSFQSQCDKTTLCCLFITIQQQPVVFCYPHIRSRQVTLSTEKCNYFSILRNKMWLHKSYDGRFFKVSIKILSVAPSKQSKLKEVRIDWKQTWQWHPWFGFGSFRIQLTDFYGSIS